MMISSLHKSADSDAQLKSLLGVIRVNIAEGEQLRFMRANKDAEVDALCLLLFWHSSNPSVHSRLIALADSRLISRPLRGPCSTPTHAFPVS